MPVPPQTDSDGDTESSSSDKETDPADHIPIMQQIREGYGIDPEFHPRDFPTGPVDGVYLARNKAIHVPNKPGLRHRLITLCHDSPYAGHKGVERTVELLQRSFTWPGLRIDVEEYVKTCQSCQRHKVPRQRPGGCLHSVEIPDSPWECVTMDFITCLPETQRGHNALMVFVDKLTKMVHLAPCNLNITAKQAAEAYRDHVFKYHGLARKIITDRDSRFTGSFMDALADALGIKQALSTAFHPQTDGQTEIMNQIVEDTLRHYVSPTLLDWDEWLTPVEFAINNSYQESIKNTPFRMNSGQDPHLPGLAEVPQRYPHARWWLEANQHMIQRARHFLKAAQDRQKHYADLKRRPVQYELGEWVWLSTKNVKFKVDGTKKLLPKYIGPFQITQFVGEDVPNDRPAPAVKLDLPRSCRIHKVFHVSLLKPYRSRPGVLPQRPEIEVDADGVPIYEVDRIVGEKLVPRRNGPPHRYFLIRWKGYSELDDTWQPVEDLNCPQLIRTWRRDHPGPEPGGRVPVADAAPVGFRPPTRVERSMLQALSQDAQPLVAVSMETLCTASKSLKILARQQPTLAALLFWDTRRHGGQSAAGAAARDPVSHRATMDPRDERYQRQWHDTHVLRSCPRHRPVQVLTPCPLYLQLMAAHEDHLGH